jgi:hypothetical protein
VGKDGTRHSSVRPTPDGRSETVTDVTSPIDDITVAAVAWNRTIANMPGLDRAQDPAKVEHSGRRSIHGPAFVTAAFAGEEAIL